MHRYGYTQVLNMWASLWIEADSVFGFDSRRSSGAAPRLKGR